MAIIKKIKDRFKKKKKHRGRWGYLQDFQRSVSGEYIYTGATYTYVDTNGRSRSRTVGIQWIWCAVMLAAIVTQGFIRAASMLNCAYVLLPFAGEIIFGFCTVWALLQLSFNRDPIREYVYKATVKALPMRALLAGVFSAAGIVGELVYVLTHSAVLTGDYLMFPLAAAAAVCALMIRRGILRTEWVREENDF